MKRSGSTPPTNYSGQDNVIILPTATIPPSSDDPTTEDGEATWSIPQLVGMVRRKIMVVGVLAIALSAYMGYKASKQVVEYQGSFQLLVEPVHERQELDSLTNEKKNTTELDYSTQIEVMLSPKTLRPILAKVESRFPGTNYESVIGSLTVIRLGETKIIQVTYKDKNAERVKQVLQELSEGYLKHSLEEQQVQLRQGLDFIEDQLPTIQNRVNTLQLEIQTLRQRYNFINPDSYGEQLAQQLGSIAQQRQNTRVDLSALKQRYDIVTAQTAERANLSEASTYQGLLQQFKALDQQIAVESARFGPGSPTIQLLRRQQEKLQPLLEQEARRALDNQQAALGGEIQVLQTRDRTIAESERQLSSRFRRMPAVSRQFAELQRELVVASESLTRFRETQERLEIEAAQNEVPWQLISPPGEPQRRPTDSLYKALVMGGMGGVVMGLILAFILEKLENTYYTPNELKHAANLPLLGVVPFNPDLVNAVPEIHMVDLRSPHLRSSSSAPADYWLEGHDAHSYLEAFRALHANLKRVGNGTLRSIVISSALPGEGRTSVAVHLAQSAAAMGKKVLLVDAHLRHSGIQIHTMLGLSNVPGLTHFLTNEQSLPQVIQRITWEKSLYVISMGEFSSDPTRLLSSPNMIQLMEALHPKVDLVLYDMPPLMGLADVNLIASRTDGVLLVTSLGKRGSAEALQQTLERLRIARLPILGVVANRAKNYTVNLYG